MRKRPVRSGGSWPDSCRPSAPTEQSARRMEVEMSGEGTGVVPQRKQRAGGSGEKKHASTRYLHILVNGGPQRTTGVSRKVAREDGRNGRTFLKEKE